MLGDLQTDTPTLVKDAIAWLESTASDVNQYLIDPNRHSGGTNDTSLELAAGRREVAEGALLLTRHFVITASDHLRDGQAELAAQVIIHGQACMGNALLCLLSVSAYETLRVDAESRAQVEFDEAQRRSTNARMGAPKPRFSDGELTEFLDTWAAEHGKTRGSKKAAAVHFNVTDAAIRVRLSKIRTG